MLFHTGKEMVKGEGDRRNKRGLTGMKTWIGTAAAPHKGRGRRLFMRRLLRRTKEWKRWLTDSVNSVCSSTESAQLCLQSRSLRQSHSFGQKSLLTSSGSPSRFLKITNASGQESDQDSEVEDQVLVFLKPDVSLYRRTVYNSNLLLHITTTLRLHLQLARYYVMI